MTISDKTTTYTELTVLTDDQIKLAFTAVLAQPPRAADVAVVQVMGATLGALAEFVHDHWMGGAGGTRRYAQVLRAMATALKVADAVEGA